MGQIVGHFFKYCLQLPSRCRGKSECGCMGALGRHLLMSESQSYFQSLLNLRLTIIIIYAWPLTLVLPLQGIVLLEKRKEEIGSVH